MNKSIGILIGLVLLLTPIYIWITNFAGFGTAAVSFLKGSVVWILILIGTICLIIGLSNLRE